MLNEVIALFVGAFNQFVDVDFYAYDEYLAILIIVVSALVLVTALAVVCTCIKAVFGAFWHSMK